VISCRSQQFVKFFKNLVTLRKCGYLLFFLLDDAFANYDPRSMLQE
jgi:hypothetical protein